MRTADISEVIETLLATLQKRGCVPIVVVAQDKKVYGILSLKEVTITNERGEDRIAAALYIGAHWSEHN